jgi:membrane-bound serine protease (ClpP class)
MIFADPNVIYLLLLVGLWASVFGIYIPGTGVVEGVAVVTLAGALIALVSNPATNWLAVLLIGAGVLGYMLIPLYRHSLARLALVGLILQAVGGIFLFSGTSVSLLIIVATIGITLFFYQFALLRILEKQTNEPSVGDEELLPGSLGQVSKALDPVGIVNVRSESWTAYSNEPLQPGETIVVVAKEGLRLYVEKAKPKRRPRQTTDVEPVDAAAPLHQNDSKS